MGKQNRIPDEVIDYALKLAIEFGMKPTHAVRSAIDRYNGICSEGHLLCRVTSHPRYIEYKRDAQKVPSVIPAQVIEDAYEVVRSNPHMGVMECVQKYKEDTGCPFLAKSIYKKLYREKVNLDRSQSTGARSGWDNYDCTLFWSLGQWKRKGLIRAVSEEEETEETTFNE